MLIYDVFLLSLVQGITEFLPISSSAHLVLFQNWLQNDFGLFFDISLHFGSIMAVVCFYRKEFIQLIKSLFLPNDKKLASERNLIFKLIVATVPIVIAGCFLYGLAESDARNIKLLAVNSIVFGVLLYIADRYFTQKKEIHAISYKNAFIIGLFQVFALIPGVSRSGATVMAARFMRVKRVDAIQFSIFLSLPAIVGAVILAVYKNADNVVFDANVILGTMLTFIFSYIVLYLFVKLARHFSFTIFAIYRVILGIILLYLFM